jgi:hypothetical protein
MTDFVKTKLGRPKGAGLLTESERRERRNARSRANCAKRRDATLQKRKNAINKKREYDAYNREEMKHALMFIRSAEGREFLNKHEELNVDMMEASLWIRNNPIKC